MATLWSTAVSLCDTFLDWVTIIDRETEMWLCWGKNFVATRCHSNVLQYPPRSYDSWACCKRFFFAGKRQMCSATSNSEKVCCSTCAAINWRKHNLLNIFLDISALQRASLLLHSHSRARTAAITLNDQTPNIILNTFTTHELCRNEYQRHVNRNQGQPEVANPGWPQFHGSMWKRY